MTLKESDIRPQNLMDQYLELSLKDALKMNPATFVAIDCPGCFGKSSRPKFDKNGFTYAQCNDCGSLYCSPRPSKESLDEFYATGESSAFWANVFFPTVAEARREKLFREKAHQIKDLFVSKKIPFPATICDVGAGYGIFLEELKKVFPDATLHAIEPGQQLAKTCRERGFETLECMAEDAGAWKHRFDLVISSEVVEHVFRPEHFVKALFDLATPKGRVLMTGLGYEGFDILVLQEKSKSVFPPHHINFLSVLGFEELFRRVGYNDVEVLTPGVLDVDIVMNSGQAPEFLKVLATRPGGLADLQELLSRHRLSSHTWILASK